MAAVLLRINMSVETANDRPKVPEDGILQIHDENAKASEVWPTSMWGLARANEQPQAAERTKDTTTPAALQSLDQTAGFGGDDPEKPRMTGYFDFLESEGEIRGSPPNAENTPVSL